MELSHGGGSGAAEHIDLLDRFLEVIEPEQSRVLVADREFTGGDLLRGLKERSVHKAKVELRVTLCAGVIMSPEKKYLRLER